MSINLQQEIKGRNLKYAVLGEALQEKNSILVFLRHLGCNLTLQLVQDIHDLENKYGVKLPITFVSQGSKNYCEQFWSGRYPQSSVIYDEDLQIAKSFKLKQGTVSDVLNPAAMFCSLKAIANGHVPTGAKGNVYMLPGIFIYSHGKQVFSHIAQHAADLPNFEKLILNFLELKAKSGMTKAA